MKRIHSIDIVKGIVMIIMALDHTRDLIHVTSITQQPTDLATTPPILLFTRWITHLCAATFVFLAAVEASKNKFTDIATVYGKVPLFYFLVHWYLIHPLLFLILFLQGFKSSDLLFGFNFGRPKMAVGLACGRSI